MRRLALTCGCLFLVTCGPGPGAVDAGSDAGSQADAGTSALADEWLAAHNAQRSAALPAPSPALEALTWNPAAAAVAEAWAAKCQFQHNAGRGNYGENIFAASGNGTVTATSVTNDWSSEKADYTWATNTCAVGKACGHYTQVVWRATTSIGCANALCTINNPFGGTGPWQFWLCDYSPPGNFVGQRPY